MKLKNNVTDQVCEFDSAEQADEFLSNVEDPTSWETEDGAQAQEAAPAKKKK